MSGEAVVIKRIIVVGCVAAAMGCGSSEERQAEEAADQVREGAEQVQRSAEEMAESGAEGMAAGLQQMAQGFQQMAQNQGEVVDFEVLKEALPQVDGWTQSNARGEQMSMPIRHSRAEARYSRGDSTVELEITDSAMNQLLLAPISMFMASGFSERSDEGFKRSASIAGHPGMEEWNSESNRGEVTVVVGKRFIVQATGYDVEELAAVHQILGAIDMSKLSSLE